MNQRWRISLLGRLSVTHAGRCITRFRSRQHASLLAYLGCYLDRSHSREELVELLWPETSPPVGRHRLCQALYSLRQQLEIRSPPEPLLLADRRSLRANPAACTTDIALFNAALGEARVAPDPVQREQRLVEAVSQYQGELLPGCCEAWVVLERQRLAEAHLKALDELRGLREAAGDIAGALLWAQRGVAADPLREEHQHALIRLLMAAGQTGAARRQYEALAELLSRELGAAPDPSIQALLRAGTARATAKPRAAEEREPAPCPVKPEHASSGAGAAPDTPPVIQPAGSASLPLQLTRFFGRGAEIVRLRTLIESAETRLVTLSGPGGTGKTRLALQTAPQLADLFPGGVWLVPLLALSDPAHLIDAIHTTLRLPRSPEVKPLEQVVAYLSRQPMLLVLDNFEQLVVGGAGTVRLLLERVPGLRVMVTSRRALGLLGEQSFPVPPLPTPGGTTKVAELRACESVQLFVDRAQAVRPDFQVTAANAAALAAVCVRLEGLPLALELAAARVGVLTPCQMLDRLEQRFELLAGRPRSGDPRHHSLRATLDWSYTLLTPEQQRFFRRLSVYRSGWSLEAAEVVCEEPRALEYLDHLRECSLVLAEEQLGEMRYRLLETLREYGAGQLSPDEQQVLRCSHARYFLELAGRARAEWHPPRIQPWCDRLELEHDNLRSALEWAMQSGAVETGLQVVASLAEFWEIRGHWTEGRAWLERMLMLSDARAHTAGRARALIAATWLVYRQGDHQAAWALGEQSLGIYRELGDRRGMAEALLGLGSVAASQKQYEVARELLEQGLAIRRELDDRAGIAASLCNIGIMLCDQGIYCEARSLLEQAYAIDLELGIRGGAAYSALGHIAFEQGDYRTARCIYEEQLQTHRELRNPMRVASALNNLGIIAYREGQYETARHHHEESLVIFRALEARGGVAVTLGHLAKVAREQGATEQAEIPLQESRDLSGEILER